MNIKRYLVTLLAVIFMVFSAAAYAQDELGDIGSEIIVADQELPMGAVAVTKNSSASQIKEVQNRLKSLKYLSKSNGKYDANTVKAVKSFQSATGLKSTGNADVETVEKLFSTDAPTFYPTLKKGANRKEVKSLKNALNKLQPKLGFKKLKANNVYDANTVNAVKAYQKAAGFKVNGQADAATQRMLFSKTPLPEAGKSATSGSVPAKSGETTATNNSSGTSGTTGTSAGNNTSTNSNTSTSGGNTVSKPNLASITDNIVTSEAAPIVLDAALCRVAVGFRGDGSSTYLVMISGNGKSDYFAFLANGATQYYPLPYGNGTYNVKILRQKSGNSYSVDRSVNVALSTFDKVNAYTGSVNLVNFGDAPNARSSASSWTKSFNKDKEMVDAVYKKLVGMMGYDYANLGKLPSYYVPNLDRVLSRKLGVCYDMASLFAGMLRAEGIPAKLCMGITNKVQGYHAWAEVLMGGQWVVVDLSVDSQCREYKMSYSMAKKASDYQSQKQY